MVDQIVDKYTAGIPSDIELVRQEVEDYKDTAVEAANRGVAAAASAKNSADAAAKSAAESKAWAILRGPGVVIDVKEPLEKTADLVWFQTRHDDTASIYPAADLYPSASLYPAGLVETLPPTVEKVLKWVPDDASDPTGAGSWKSYGIAESLLVK